MKILLCGDSFSYDHKIAHSWPTRLLMLHQVDNLSQCGCSEYKIKLQIQSQSVSDYDAVLIFHTSPYRIYLNRPSRLHINDSHKDADLLFADVEHHRHHNQLAQHAYDYFKHIFDADYYCYMHNLICSDIHQNTKSNNVHHFTAFDYSKLYQFDNTLTDLYNTWTSHQGDVNHLSPTGHDVFFETITGILAQ